MLERDHRKLVDAVDEETRWLRDAVEAVVALFDALETSGPHEILWLLQGLGLDLATLSKSILSQSSVGAAELSKPARKSSQVQRQSRQLCFGESQFVPDHPR